MLILQNLCLYNEPVKVRPDITMSDRSPLRSRMARVVALSSLSHGEIFSLGKATATISCPIWASIRFLHWTILCCLQEMSKSGYRRCTTRTETNVSPFCIAMMGKTVSCRRLQYELEKSISNHVIHFYLCQLNMMLAHLLMASIWLYAPYLYHQRSNGRYIELDRIIMETCRSTHSSI